MTTWHCEHAWLGGACESRVRIAADADRITSIDRGVDAEPGDVLLAGITLPGLANAHSHAFHRALRGRTHDQAGDFWAWRDAMYDIAQRLDPDSLLALARATYAEMALSGITAVGEFHYLHHQPDGRPYANPNEMGATLAAAAEDAGIRLTLLDTCYLRAGFDEPLGGHQRRFGDGDALAWSERTAALADTPMLRVGAAVHSVRAVDPDSMAVVADAARARRWRLHLHLSEQPAENEACQRATGLTPTALAAERGVLGPATTAVHATHVTAPDIARLASTGTSVCLCPTTERDLGDGIGCGGAMHEAGSALCVGTDSHAMIDVFEEARAIELDERLLSGRRGRHAPSDLLDAATRAGHRALGWDAGELAVGSLADFVTVDLTSPRLAGFEPADAAAHIVFSATAADVRTVVVGGRTVVEDGHHASLPAAGAALRSALDLLDR